MGAPVDRPMAVLQGTRGRTVESISRLERRGVRSSCELLRRKPLRVQCRALFFSSGSGGDICILGRRWVDVTRAVFWRVGLNFRRTRAARGWVIALGAGRFGRVFRVWVWMLVSRLLGLLIIGRHVATFPSSTSIGDGVGVCSCLHLCYASERVPQAQAGNFLDAEFGCTPIQSGRSSLVRKLQIRGPGKLKPATFVVLVSVHVRGNDEAFVLSE